MDRYSLNGINAPVKKNVIPDGGESVLYIVTETPASLVFISFGLDDDDDTHKLILKNIKMIRQCILFIIFHRCDQAAFRRKREIVVYDDQILRG